jgi:CubicO group peptidase (beta-lactamase class C family)
MLLVEDGVVDLHEPITRWLPDVPAHWRMITPHQMLCHTSGLGHWNDVPDFDIAPSTTSDELITRFLTRLAELPLFETPGGTYRYSSPGYFLATEIVRQASGQPYARFLGERLFAPLGMTSTSAGQPPATGAAYGYNGDQRVDSPEFAGVPGPGDIWSTVDDLARYTAAFNNGRILEPSSRDAMCAPHAQVSGKPDIPDLLVTEQYGYGYELGAVGGRPSRFHTGSNPGYRALHAWLPDHDSTIVLLTNDETAPAEQLIRHVIAL